MISGNLPKSAEFREKSENFKKIRKSIGFSNDKYLRICQNLPNFRKNQKFRKKSENTLVFLMINIWESAKICRIPQKSVIWGSNCESDQPRTVSGPESPFRLQKTANMTPATQTAHPPAALRNSGLNCESEDYTFIGERILQCKSHTCV